MHVVFGANGRAGGETARALMSDGEPVRVVVRRPEQGKAWAALGAEVAVASLDNAEQVSAALKGATAAFLLNPPPSPAIRLDRQRTSAQHLPRRSAAPIWPGALSYRRLARSMRLAPGSLPPCIRSRRC